MLSKSQITITAILAVTASLAIAAPGHDRFPIDISEVESKVAERFAKMDADGNGTVELTEFEAAKHPRRGHHGRHGARQGKGAGKGHGRMQHDGEHRGKANPDRDAIRAQAGEEMFAILDANSDGTVSKTEYSEADHHAARKLARKRAMFKQLDKDASGALTSDELPNPAARIKQADADGDGQVTRDEMHAARQNRRAS